MNKQTRDRLLKIVKQNYSAIAADFDLSRQKPNWPELAKLVNTLIDGRSQLKVLDVGCGNGRLRELLPPDTDYLGIDNCPELITLAQSQQPGRFLVGDLLELNQVPDVNFDLVCCIAALHHIPGQPLRLEALRQLKSKLKPGGYLLITNWNLWQQRKYRKLIWRFALLKLIGKQQMDFGDILFYWKKDKLTGHERYYHAFCKHELKRLAIAAGLEIVINHKDPYNYYLVLKK